MRICVLDLGGMSFHLLHVRAVGDSQFAHLGSLRLATRLGKHTIQAGVIDAEGFRHAMEDLAILSEEIRSPRARPNCRRCNECRSSCFQRTRLYRRSPKAVWLRH